ncbi:MAG: hypothetical protein OEW15_01940 [Nitrospirota bacterium]|nr:hypothetical protein [Nitrospirota bacterium]
MKPWNDRSYRDHAVALAALAAASFILYYDYWLGTKVFSGKDFLTAFYPLLNFQTDCLQAGSWPLWNPFMNFGYPYVEHYVNSTLFPTHLFMGLVTGSTLFLIQRELLIWIIVGGFGVYLCTRELGLRTVTGIVAGLSFMGCGQIIALPQWSTLVYNAACFPYLILGYHRAKRQETPFSPLSIAFLSFTIFGGYIVTSVLGIYLFAGYVLIDAALSRRPLFAVKYLVTTIALSVVLTLPKLLPLYAGMGAGPRLSYSPSGGPFDTFNLISPYNLLSLLLPVKYYFSLFLGTIGIIALIHGIVKKSHRFTALASMTVLSGWLLISGMDGSPSLLRTMASLLPFMRLVRNDWLSWFFPTIFAILFLARPIEDLLSDKDRKRRYLAGGIYAGLLTIAFFAAYSSDLYLEAYLVHLGITAAVIFLPDLRLPLAADRAMVLLLFIELLLVFHRVNIDVPPMRKGELLAFTVVDQASVSRSYFEDNRIRSAFRAVAVDDRLRPTIDQAKERPALFSGLHGMPGINYSQDQYGMFIDDMNLKRFSGWWYNTQERFDFIRLKESPLLEALDGMPLYTFSAPSGRPVPGVIRLIGLSCSSFLFSAEVPEAGSLILRQMFDDRWAIRVDGRPTVVNKTENSFLKVDVDAGRHEIQMSFTDRIFASSGVTSLCAFAAMMAWVLFRRKRRLKPTMDTTAR